MNVPDERTQPRIALLVAGNARDPELWSGTPANLARAFEELGVELSPVSSEPPRVLAAALLNTSALLRMPGVGRVPPVEALRQARRQTRVSPAASAVHTSLARRRLARLEQPDAIVQLNAECRLDTAVPWATYEDLTIVQALRHGYREWTQLSAFEQQRRVAQQGAVYRATSACCTTTGWVRDSIVEDYGLPPEKVHVVGVGCERATTDTERDWSTPRFLFVGIDWKRKNGDAVVRAFVGIRATHPGAELHVVGGHPRLDAEGVTGHGRLRLGRPADRSAVVELFRRATCFVLPSWVEPSAIAYLEAASFGLPSLVTAVGGSAELVGEGGVVIEPGDDNALATAMAELCHPGRARALGARARARSALFTWPRVAARILTALGVRGFAEPSLAPPRA